LLFYYAAKFTEPYSQNIKFALEMIDLSSFDEFGILSIGCGASPDLMAFEEIANGRFIYYNGVDRNLYWSKFRDVISNSVESKNIEVSFETRDVTVALEMKQPLRSFIQQAVVRIQDDTISIICNNAAVIQYIKTHEFELREVMGNAFNFPVLPSLSIIFGEPKIYNVVVMQYVISSILSNGGNKQNINNIFLGLVDTALRRWKESSITSPFLFILNDVDSINTGRNCFFKLLDILEKKGYAGVAYAYSGHPNGDLGENRWSERKGMEGFGNITYNYSPVISNNSATLTIEVRK
jgi:hypothetical protein